MLTDLVINPFGADVREIVALAVEAERAGFDGVWTFDHLSGVVSMSGRWSCDPFVVLGAVAATTERVRLGVLVANVVNRHPVQLASAMSSLSMLAPDRVMCGMGSGAAPDSVFAAEQRAVGREVDSAAVRRARLVEHIEAVRAIWSAAGVSAAGMAGAAERTGTGEAVTFRGEHVTMDGVTAVVRPGPAPPIIVGSSGPSTVRVAAEMADGVNIRRTERLAELVDVATTTRRERAGDGVPFEISVFERLDEEHPLGGDVEELASLGVGARTLYVAAPFDHAVVRAVGGACRAADLSR